MAEVFYEALPATDGVMMNPVPGAVFEVFEIADTTYTTPLSLRVGAGNPSTTVTASDPQGIVPGVYVTSDNFEHNWKSGDFVWRRDSIDGAKAEIQRAESSALAAANAAADVQLLAESGAFEGPQGPQGAPGRDGSNVLPTDEAITEALTTPGTPANTALNATIAEALSGYAVGDPIDAFFAKLDFRADAPLVIASCSDSTGDQANEWYEMALKESFAALWPERPVQLTRWIPGSEAYGLNSPGQWETWQTGASDPVTETEIVYKDTFTRMGALAGSAPDTGFTYTGDSLFQANGSELIITEPPSSFGTGVIAQSEGITKDGPDFSLSGRLRFTPTGTESTFAEIRVGPDAGNTIRLNIIGQATPSARMQIATGGQAPVQLAAFTTTPYSSTPTWANYAINLTGTALSATLGSETVTATLTSTQVSALTGATYGVFYRTSNIGFGADDTEMTASVTTGGGAAPAPGVDVYNGGAAGQPASYQLARIDTMYPFKPDILFINEGHNYAASIGPTAFLEQIQAFVDAIESKHGAVPVAVISQNPRFGTTSDTEHKARMIALRDYARRMGWGYIPTHEAFDALPDGGASMVPDGVHPGIGTGRRLQADVANVWLRSRSGRPST